jgi:hypothetical protein
MSTIDLSRLTPDDYPKLIELWKKNTAIASRKRASVYHDGSDLVLGAVTETTGEYRNELCLEFCLLPKTDTLEVILRSGRWIIWAMPTDDVASDPSDAYSIFEQQAEDREGLHFARQHKQFFLEEWKQFVSLFADRESS